MRKAPCYSSGGKIKGDPKNPTKTTIDRSKYTKQLSAPIEGTGTNVVGENQDNFSPEVLKNMGYEYVSGTMAGKDIVYKKGDNYHLYNEQPNAAQNKYGLINIGNPYAVQTTATPPPTTTQAGTTQPAPIARPIDPNKKPLDFSNPNLIYDPNTGGYKNNVTGAMIQPIVEQYKNGGKVKPLSKYYAAGGSIGYNEKFQAANQYTPEQNPVQDPNQNQKSGNGKQLMNQAGTALGAYGTGYFGSQQDENKGEDFRNKAFAGIGQTGPIGGVIAGGAALGDNIGKPIKARSELTDSEGNLVDEKAARRNALIGGLFSPSKALATRNSYEGGWTDVTGKKYTEHLENQAKEEIAKQQAEAAERNRILNEGRTSEAILARDLGELNYDDGYLKTKKDARREVAAKGAALNSFADGGVITGPGTTKSDSIPAKIKPGSHIIPAENAPIAKEILRKVLGKDISGAANLNQTKGTPVMVSKEEVIVTKPDKEKLESVGIDLNQLSPDSDNNDIDSFAKGGGVDPKEELSKLRSKKSASVQKRKDESQAEKQANKRYSSAKEIVDATRDFNNLNKQIEELNKQYAEIQERETNTDKRLIGESDMRIDEQKEAVLNRLSEVMGRRDQIQTNLGGRPGTNVPKSTASEQGINYMTGKNITPSVTQIEDTAQKTTTPSKATGKSSARTQNKPLQTTSAERSVLAPDYLQPVTAGVSTTNPDDLQLRTSTPSATEQNFINTINNQTNKPAPKAGNKFDYSNILGNAINYGIPALQTGIGLRNLKQAGDRPIDSLSTDYLQALNKEKQNVLKAEKMAEYGFSPEERSLLDMQNQNLTNAGRYNARNLTGGGAANALGAERAVLNDAFGRNLMTAVNDRNLQLQKQQMAMDRQENLNSLVQDKQNRLRQYFGDSLSGWNQNQAAGSQLVGAGIQNLIGADRYRQEREALEKRQRLSDNWLTGI